MIRITVESRNAGGGGEIGASTELKTELQNLGMITNLYQDASAVFNSTTHHFSKISDNLANSKITENVTKISEAINKRLHFQHRLNCGALNPETNKRQYKKLSPHSLYSSLTRLEVRYPLTLLLNLFLLIITLPRLIDNQSYIHHQLPSF